MATPPPGGFSLFPNTSRDRSRTPSRTRQPTGRARSESRDRARSTTPQPTVVTQFPTQAAGRGRTTPQPASASTPHPASASTVSPQERRTPQTPSVAGVLPSTSPKAGRRTPQAHSQAGPSQSFTSPVESQPSTDATLQATQDARKASNQGVQSTQHSVQQPRQAADLDLRSGSAFSEAPTLVRSPSLQTRRSMEKLPIQDEEPPPAMPGQPAPAASPVPQQPLRSIFPTYNPEIPLADQQYFPTQKSPTHIPRNIISRLRFAAPSITDSNGEGAAIVSPTSPSSRWRRRTSTQAGHGAPPKDPKVNSTETLKGLWKVTNGWRASPSEGRVYCLRLTQEKDAPIYTLSSATQPFYNIRLDPTSAAAKVTVMRYDPSKPYRPVSSSNDGGGSIVNGIGGKSSDVNIRNWQEVMSTTLEEESRKHKPNDGLVSELTPSAARRAADDRPDDAFTVMMAQRKCARLVWDEDSERCFLVHPALATPFCVTMERTPAWSRVEYTLEHHESPQHLARLTRDGTGGGWLEVDTALASKIESYYIVDVAVTALLLVASADDKYSQAETFEPPPCAASMAFPAPAHMVDSTAGHRRMSRRSERRMVGKARSKQRRRKMEEFEIDVESQDSSIGKGGKESELMRELDGLPMPIRVVVRLMIVLFKCFIWGLTMVVRVLGWFIRTFGRCVGFK